MVEWCSSAMTAFTMSIYDRISFFSSYTFSDGSTTRFEFIFLGLVTAFNKKLEFNSVANYLALSGTVKLKPLEALRHYLEETRLEETRVLLKHDSSIASLSLVVWCRNHSKLLGKPSKNLECH
jgi:hypothetical protein